MSAFAKNACYRLAFASVLAVSFNVFAQGALDIDAGVVVKFGPNSGIEAHTQISTKGEVTLTSTKDDTVLGPTLNQPSTPSPGDWLGLRITNKANLASTLLDKLRIRYAGGNGRGALQMEANKNVRNIVIENSTLGLSAGRGAAFTVNETVLTGNVIGLQSKGAMPSITDSDLSSNTTFGAQNLSPSLINARGNFWGAASGPYDPLDNPAGQGSPVSAGVDYGNYLSNAPLLDCALAPADNMYLRSDRAVTFNTRCRNATELRISESRLFSGSNFSLLTATRDFLLSANAGDKRVYAQFRSAQGLTKTVVIEMRLQFAGPLVRILRPLDLTRITTTNPVTIEAAVQAPPGDSIRELKFYLNETYLGADTSEPYLFDWQPTGVSNGNYSIRAVATTTVTQSTGGDSKLIIVALPTGPADTQAPTITDLRFDAQALVNGLTISDAGNLKATIRDAGCVGVACRIDVRVRLNGIDTDSQLLTSSDFSAYIGWVKVLNGPVRIEILANDLAGNETRVVRDVTLALTAPMVPTLLLPSENQRVSVNPITVFGTARPNARIQIYVNDQADNERFIADENGQFQALRIELPAEGLVQITADATNGQGTSPRSAVRTIDFQLPPASITISEPPLGRVVSASTLLRASVLSLRAGSTVELFVNGVSLGVDTTPPFEATFNPVGQSNGVKTVRAELREPARPMVSTESQFLYRAEQPPAPIQAPPYVGIALNATPTTSSGNSDVVISGRMRRATGTQPEPNAPTVLVLRNSQNLDRRVQLLTDASGQFSYAYRPRSSDAGIIRAFAMHPDAQPFENPTLTGVTQFNVQRLTSIPTRIALQAARGFAQPFSIKVKNSSGTANNVRLVLRPQDQPSNTLPSGISFDGGKSQNIDPEGEATFSVSLTSTQSSPPSGNLIIAVLEDATGTERRASTRVDFELLPAQPALQPQPASLLTGARRGNAATTEIIQISNRGLVTATAVQASLQAVAPATTVPNWVSLVSSGNIGNVLVGETRSIELRFSPTAAVADGVYDFRLLLVSTNTAQLTVPISVAVNASGNGSVKFTAQDIFSNTLDASNQLIPGLADARIVLTNEANATISASGTTNALGELVLGPLPVGRYVYQAQGPSHEPASGRVLIRPSATTPETVFLDYNTVSFTWSVTPTTITDLYNVNLSAVYATNVPAPVIQVEPKVINIPTLEVGAFVSGEITLSNLGLVRADALGLENGQVNPFYRVDLFGQIPDSLEAGQQVTLQYKITALQDFTGAPVSSLQRWLGNAPNTRAPQGANCRSFSHEYKIRFEYRCANGALRKTQTGGSFTRTTGSTCTTPSAPVTYVYGCPASGCAGGSFGGFGGGYTPPPAGGCGPDCNLGCACGYCSTPPPPETPPGPPHDPPRPPPTLRSCRTL